MSKPEETVDTTKAHSCGVDIDVHFAQVFQMARQAGIGALCIDAYQAMVEYTEFIRVKGGHEVYTPTAYGIGTRFAHELAANEIPSRQPNVTSYNRSMFDILASISPAFAEELEEQHARQKQMEQLLESLTGPAEQSLDEEIEAELAELNDGKAEAAPTVRGSALPLKYHN